MNAETKLRKIDIAIKETESLLEKAIIKYEGGLKYLEMEKAENIELGNDDSANDHAIQYVKETEERVTWLKNHINKLEQMKLS